jgi:hypothetical protein
LDGWNQRNRWSESSWKTFVKLSFRVFICGPCRDRRRRRRNNNTYNNTISFTMATPSRGGGGNRVSKQHISKRVLNRWETLVYEAMMAEKRRQSARQGGGGDDDSFGGGDTTTSSAALVPQSLQQQRNIDAILRTADDVQQVDPQVARICKLCLQACIFSHHLPLNPKPLLVLVLVLVVAFPPNPKP